MWVMLPTEMSCDGGSKKFCCPRLSSGVHSHRKPIHRSPSVITLEFTSFHSQHFVVAHVLTVLDFSNLLTVSQIDRKLLIPSQTGGHLPYTQFSDGAQVV